MLIVIVDNETKAYDASKALDKLDEQGDITVYGDAVIEKKANGKVELKKTGEGFPIKTLGGTAIGSLIGLLGGPVGVLIGATAGTAVGGFYDLYGAGVGADFLQEASAKLTPGKFAVVADISEEWVTPLDTEMEKLDGTVFRAAKRDVETKQRKKDQAAMKEDIKKLKTEASKSKAEHKAKLQQKINSLEKKLQNQKEQTKQRSQEIKKEQDAKVQALKKKSAEAKGKLKGTIEARIAEIKARSKKS